MDSGLGDWRAGQKEYQSVQVSGIPSCRTDNSCLALYTTRYKKIGEAQEFFKAISRREANNIRGKTVPKIVTTIPFWLNSLNVARICDY
jgi:hypothetical protein